MTPKLTTADWQPTDTARRMASLLSASAQASIAQGVNLLAVCLLGLGVAAVLSADSWLAFLDMLGAPPQMVDGRSA
jgi:hypothetical protein